MILKFFSKFFVSLFFCLVFLISIFSAQNLVEPIASNPGGNQNGNGGFNLNPVTSGSFPSVFFSESFPSFIEFKAPNSEVLTISLVGPHGEIMQTNSVSIASEDPTGQISGSCTSGCFEFKFAELNFKDLVDDEETCKFGPGPYNVYIGSISSLSVSNDNFQSAYNIYNCKGVFDILDNVKVPENWEGDDGYLISCATRNVESNFDYSYILNLNSVNVFCTIKNKELDKEIFAGFPVGEVKFSEEIFDNFLEADLNGQYQFPFEVSLGEVSFNSVSNNVYSFKHIYDNKELSNYFILFDKENKDSFFTLSNFDYFSSSKVFSDLIDLSDSVMDSGTEFLMVNDFGSGNRVVSYQTPFQTFSTGDASGSPSLDFKNPISSLDLDLLSPVYILNFNGIEPIDDKCELLLSELNGKSILESSSKEIDLNDIVICHNNDILINTRSLIGGSSNFDFSKKEAFTLLKNMVFNLRDNDLVLSSTNSESHVGEFVKVGFNFFNNIGPFNSNSLIPFGDVFFSDFIPGTGTQANNVNNGGIFNVELSDNKGTGTCQDDIQPILPLSIGPLRTNNGQTLSIGDPVGTNFFEDFGSDIIRVIPLGSEGFLDRNDVDAAYINFGFEDQIIGTARAIVTISECPGDIGMDGTHINNESCILKKNIAGGFNLKSSNAEDEVLATGTISRRCPIDDDKEYYMNIIYSTSNIDPLNSLTCVNKNCGFVLVQRFREAPVSQN